MSEVSPDNPSFYESPLSTEVLAAIGRLITCWAGIETALPLQIGRLVAIGPDLDTGRLAIDQPSYTKAAAAFGGTNPRAAVMQIRNLLAVFDSREATTAAAKKAGERLIALFERRNEIAHQVAEQGKSRHSLRLRCLQASKGSMWMEKHYTIDEIDAWTNELKEQARTIDALITSATGYTWKQIEEDRERFIQARAKLVD